MAIYPKVLMKDFSEVAKLSGIDLSPDDISVESLHRPHCPPKNLPKNRMAVYVFCYKGRTLKVGKAGPKSGARYTSHHYNPGAAKSNLAASLLCSGHEIGIQELLDKNNVKGWIKKNTHRYNFIVNSSHPIRVLNLLEAFLQCKLDPKFEGFKSQR